MLLDMNRAKLTEEDSTAAIMIATNAEALAATRFPAPSSLATFVLKHLSKSN